MTIRILSTSQLVDNHIKTLGEQFPQLVITNYRSPTWINALSTVEAIIVTLSESINETDLKLATKLKVIGTYSVGTNHIPIDFCKNRGIKIVSTPGVLTNATADLALAILLNLTRKLRDGENLIRSGNWHGWEPNQLLGTSLSGMTCGIIGSGAIGQAFARRINTIGMKPVFWARSSYKLVDYGNGTAPRLPLDELLSISNVLSLHCPLTKETKGLLSNDKLMLLPNGAFIINTARGGILDENAVIQMLRCGKIGGVGLDVYDNEPDINQDWFTSPNTVLLPHLGSATNETRSAMAKILCDDITLILNS